MQTPLIIFKSRHSQFIVICGLTENEWVLFHFKWTRLKSTCKWYIASSVIALQTLTLQEWVELLLIATNRAEIQVLLCHYDVTERAAAVAGMIFGVAAHHGWMNVAETLITVQVFCHRLKMGISLSSWSHENPFFPRNYIKTLMLLFLCNVFLPRGCYCLVGRCFRGLIFSRVLFTVWASRRAAVWCHQRGFLPRTSFPCSCSRTTASRLKKIKKIKGLYDNFNPLLS